MVSVLARVTIGLAAALLVDASFLIKPSKNWMGETKLHQMFDDHTVAQLQKDGLIKTRQNPDYPHRTQYFVVKTPADAAFISSECPQKPDDEHSNVQNSEVTKTQKQGKEWIATEKLRESYGDDTAQQLVKAGLLEKREDPDFPERTQLGKSWISTQNLLEKYGFDKAKELLTSGRVEKRQNPSCPERTQYFVKEESMSSAHTDEEMQKPENAEVQNQHETKLHKHGKSKKRERDLQMHDNNRADVQNDEEVEQSEDETEVQKHKKATTHEGNLKVYDSEGVEVQSYEDEKAEVQKQGKANKHEGRLKPYDNEGDYVQNGEAEMQNQDEAKVEKHVKAKKHDGNLKTYDSEGVNVHNDEEGEVQQHQDETMEHNHKNAEKHNGKLQDDVEADVQDADVVEDYESEYRSAAVPARFLTSGVAIVACAFFV